MRVYKDIQQGKLVVTFRFHLEPCIKEYLDYFKLSAIRIHAVIQAVGRNKE